MKKTVDDKTEHKEMDKEQEIVATEPKDKVAPNDWFRKTVVLGSIGASIVAFLGLLGYVPGLRTLGSIRLSYVPMAPSTAICFLVLSTILFACNRKYGRGFVFKFLGILPLFVMAFGLLVVAESFIGKNLTFEGSLVSGVGTIGGIPIGRMSPVTGFVFFVVGLGIFILLWSRNSRQVQRFRNWASILGTLVVLIGTTVLLGYIYGTPFLYGGTIVPMAATTAIAFILLGDALVAAAGPKSFPLNQVMGISTSARLLRVFFPLMVVIVFVQSVLTRLESIWFGGNDALMLATVIIIMGVLMTLVIDRVSHFMGYNLDELNKTLKESEERFRALYFNSKDAIMVLTPEEGFTAGNPATVLLFGCQDEKDFTSRSPAELSPKYQPDGALSSVKAQEMMTRALKNGSNFFEWTHRRANGEDFPATVLLSSLEVNGKMVLQATVRDITERKKMEQELLLSSEVTKNMAEGVYLIRVSDVAIVYANPGFEKMFGYKPGEMIGKHASIVNAPTDKKPEETAKEIMAVLEKTGEWHGEVNNIKKDGTPFWCWANVSVFEHPQYGKVLVAVHTDITERKRAEDETKESERLLNLYVHNVPVGIIEWDKDFQVVNWNPAAEKIFGYTKAEAMGRHANFIIPEEVRPHVDEIWKQLLSGAVTLSTNENITKDGRTIVCEWHNAPLTTAEGKVFGVVSMMLDITERKKVEEELGKSEQRYKALVDSAPLCIKLFDAQGNLVSVNKHAKEEHMLVGKSDEEIKKWKYMECIEPAYRTLVVQRMKEALEGKKSEFEFEHVPGTTTIGHWCYSYLTPVADESGKISHVLFVSRDITADKEVSEKEQKNIAQLTKLNEAMIGREIKMVELKKVLRQAQDEIERLKNSQKSDSFEEAK